MLAGMQLGYVVIVVAVSRDADTLTLHPYVIIGHLIPNTWALKYCNNRLHSSGMTLHKTF